MNLFYQLVAERANHRCEYCHAPEVIFNFPFEVEHIIPLSKTGKNEVNNLALACRSCNLRKGIRIAGVLAGSDEEIRFFQPRQDVWTEHFQVDLNSGEIIGLTAIAKVTVQYLQMNSVTQTAARQLWFRLGLFP